MKKINILFLVHGFNIGGVQKANINMINKISKEKFNVHVLYINEGELKEDLVLDEIMISKLGSKLKLKSIATIKYVALVARYVKKHDIDIIHTIDPTLYVVGAIVSRILRVIHVRTQPNFIRRHEKLNAKTLKILPFEKWTDKYITYNMASNKDLQLAGVSSHKIETIYGFAYHEEYLRFGVLTDIRDEFNIPKNYKIILAMHRMVPRKGYETFVEMIPYILSDYKNVCFLLIGDGPLRHQLETRVEDLGIERHVRFTGFRRDIANIIKQVDFGVYPLADTAAMNTVIQAGKVLITKKNSAMDEYIIDEVTGYLTPNDEPKTYAEYSLKLLRNDTLLKDLERNQEKHVIENFDGKKNIKKLEEIFISLYKTRYMDLR